MNFDFSSITNLFDFIALIWASMGQFIDVILGFILQMLGFILSGIVFIFSSLINFLPFVFNILSFFPAPFNLMFMALLGYAVFKMSFSVFQLIKFW